MIPNKHTGAARMSSLPALSMDRPRSVSGGVQRGLKQDDVSGNFGDSANAFCTSFSDLGMSDEPDHSGPVVDPTTPTVCNTYTLRQPSFIRPSSLPKGNILNIPEGETGYDYERIFGVCCDDTVTTVIVEDRYAVKETYQMRNWSEFCWRIAARCPTLERIELHSSHWHQDLFKLMVNLRKQRRVALLFTACGLKENHERMYKFNNGWTVISDIGLDIYSDGYKEYEAGYANYKARLTKKTHFVYRPPNETMSISMVAEMPGSDSRNEDDDGDSLSIISEPPREPRKLSLPADVQAATGHENGRC